MYPLCKSCILCVKKVVADDQLELGSGLLDDKDDYLDDDYKEDDEYYDDDYEDDYEEGSGLNLELEGKHYTLLFYQIKR